MLFHVLYRNNIITPFKFKAEEEEIKENNSNQNIQNRDARNVTKITKYLVVSQVDETCNELITALQTLLTSHLDNLPLILTKFSILFASIIAFYPVLAK